MQMLVVENAKMLSMLNDNSLRDFGLIASAQKYGIAGFGTAAALAGQLDLRDDQRMLYVSLEEEKRVDAQLTTLAKGEVNLRDRRAVARYAGITGSPDESGSKRREKGLTKSGTA